MSALTLPSSKISIPEAERIAAVHYEVEARAFELAGEKDDNFRLVTKDDCLLLKVVHATEPAEVTNLVTSALLHMERVAPEIPVQRVIPVASGGPELRFQTSSGEERTARLTTFIDGRLLAGVSTTSSLRVSLGAILARIAHALKSFRHPAASRDLLWDLQNSDRVRGMLREIDVQDRGLLTSCFDRFDERVKPNLMRQRTQIVHNDLSADNVVLKPDSDTIEGVIDFGDVTETQMINDVAIAAANQLADDDPFGPAIDLVRGYHEVEPLYPAELALLYDLVRTRTALQIVISQWRARRFPQFEKYVMRKTPRCWTLLRAMDPGAEPEVTSRLIESCGS